MSCGFFGLGGRFRVGLGRGFSVVAGSGGSSFRGMRGYASLGKWLGVWWKGMDSDDRARLIAG